MLFGGIDLDPSDRVLGLLLASEQQHRRRQQRVMHALEQAGVRQAPEPPSAVKRALSSFTLKRKAKAKAKGLDTAGTGMGMRESAGMASTASTGPGSQAMWLDGSKSSLVGHKMGSAQLSAQLPVGERPLYRHDFMRLTTFRQSEVDRRAVSNAAAGHEPPQLVPLAAQAVGSASFGAQQQLGAVLPGPGLKVASRYEPMLAPSGCARRLDPANSPQQAAAIYCGWQEPVDAETLRCGGLQSCACCEGKSFLGRGAAAGVVY
jgi:hypothetical protein